MASIQARHARGCGLYPWSTYKAAGTAECSCTPMYHAVFRHGGKLVRDPLGHNRKEAKRALDAVRGDIARKKYRPLQDVRFEEWSQQWLAGFTGKENTLRVYRTTMAYAVETFGQKQVRDLAAADVRDFLATVARRSPRKGGAQPGTLAKHLRQLATCLEAAMGEGYAAENPVKRLHKSQRPKSPKQPPVYFTGDELARLWPELVGRPVYLALFKLAATTGMRVGELLALRWSDVDLLNREISVARTYVAGLGEQPTTKTGKGRTIDLNPQAATVLEQWLPQPDAEGLVFERETSGHIDPSYITKRVLYPAMTRAGIPREGEHGRLRDFHSMRHSFAKVALENGVPITWVSQQLGHSNITITVNDYGGWERKAEKAQAAALAGFFSV